MNKLQQAFRPCYGHFVLLTDEGTNAYDLLLAQATLFSGGSIGTVSVDWYIDGSYTTAVKGQDYFADGATLTFRPGETTRGLLLVLYNFYCLTVAMKETQFCFNIYAQLL